MFKKAIDLIMAEPPELHYPAYFADLLRKADVPDENVGKCSEIPNSSETIYRQAAIDTLSVGKEILNRVLDETDVVGTEREKFSFGLGLIESSIKDIEELPSAQPERKKGKWIDAVLQNDNSGLPVQVCDQCNTFFPLAYTGGGHRFCPNCGADMRGDSDV